VYVGDGKVQQGGVAIKTNARAKRALMDWTSFSKRKVKARFYTRRKKLTVIQTYAPTNDAMDEERDEFFPTTAGHSIKLQQKRHDCGDG